MGVCIYIYINGYVWSGIWHSRPPQWYGLVIRLDGGEVLRKGVTRKQYPSNKPYNVVRAPLFINLNLYFKPYTQATRPKCRL